ncbi:unnamed protein product [Periconia digitata]|uniref:Uncharacterized protein n=1 Tax=Periconia digitata TaxID=1303443 RepID=A0A9W4U7N7_9PLEO|nr:unnamed protein product [Periconia digitata]
MLQGKLGDCCLTSLGAGLFFVQINRQPPQYKTEGIGTASGRKSQCNKEYMPKQLYTHANHPWFRRRNSTRPPSPGRHAIT